MATQSYDARASGAGLFAVHLAEALAAAGHEPLVIAPSDRGPGYRTIRHGVRLELIRSFPLRPFTTKVRLSLHARRRVDGLFEDFEPEVVHAQDHYPLGRVALDVACHHGVPVLATNHFLPENMIPYLPFPRRSRPAVSRLLWSWVTRTYNRAALVTTPSRAGVAAIRAAGLRPQALAVSCGVDREFFRPLPELDRASVRRQLDLDPDAVTLLFAGRLERDKRLDVLLAALSSFDREEDPSPGTQPAHPPQLIVTGTGMDEARWRRLAKRLGLERRVVFTGFVTRQSLLELLNSADIFAMPSEAELLSIATLEAMAVGMPILAADAWALPELVEPGVNGELFRPGDPEDAARRLRQLCERRADWPRMAEASRGRAREHDFRGVVTRYEALYRDLAAGPRPTAAS
ncbi:MAG: glycosyltransferase [Candidatus Limnocylindrales bacterium]